MTATASIVEILGGKAALKRKVSTAAQLTEAIREGLPYSSLEALLAKLRISRNEASAVLHLPERTLARRRKEKRLRPDESDRVLRLARLFSLAQQVLETEENASTWFSQPNRSMAGQTPLAMIDTEVGAREVEETLWRIAHGIFS
jgi:putative toxin-antitoxin system antitoxin component (TIGR02293 family)